MSEIDEEKLHELLEEMVRELGAAANGPLVIVGEKLGLYRALAQHGPLDAGGLAGRTGTNERYVREWLSAQACSGYIEYDPETGDFSMTPEQVAVLADPDSPVLMPGGFFGLVAMYKETDLLADVFRSGDGIEWGDHDDCLFCGTEKFFKPTYEDNLVSDWIPALDGVQEKLAAGARVADVGCGRGASTRIMARAFPDSEFVGFDFHAPSIAYAREAATGDGAHNVAFEVATAREYPGDGYDLVCFFDCLHDMGDPAGAASHVLETLDDDGTWMIVEPMAGDSLEENMHPVGRAFYAFSTAICTPSSLSQEVGLALGAQAGEKRLREVVTSGGFGRFRRATETPFNLILEARP